MAGEYIEFDNNNQPAVNDTNLNRLQQLIKQDIQGAVSGDTLPIGTIVPFGSNTVPENWLLCDGSAVSRTQYQDLFNTIGITFGQGDGFETFNLPDLRDRVPVGKDSNDTDFNLLGNTGGNKKNTYNFNHTHAMRLAFTSTYTNQNGVQYTAGSTVPTKVVATQGSNWSSISSADIGTRTVLDNKDISTIQPYIVTNYIIKAFQSAGTVATVVDNLNSTSTTDALSANQGNVLKGVSLYSNSTGDSGTITLSDSINNYLKVEIVYYVSYSDGNVYSTTGKIPVSSRIHLSSVFIGANSQFNSYCKRLNASGTQITVGSDRHYNISTGSGSGTDGTYTYITEVIGYNY